MFCLSAPPTSSYADGGGDGSHTVYWGRDQREETQNGKSTASRDKTEELVGLAENAPSEDNTKILPLERGWKKRGSSHTVGKQRRIKNKRRHVNNPFGYKPHTYR